MTSSESQSESVDDDPAPPAIESLTRAHKRKGFVCQVAPELQEYLQHNARHDAKRETGQTYVAVWPDQTIVGYYTLASISVEMQDLPETLTRKLPRYPVLPAVMLGRLAIDDRYARQGYGEFLLMDALHRVARVSREIGVYAVITEPRDQDARAFYEHYDFKPFPERTDRLFLPMKMIRQLFPKA